MCGFNAIFSPRQAVDQERLSKGIGALHHRGPDHRSTWISQDRMIGLGHARLSIIDLTPTGDQPLSSADGSIKAVVNGELYDFERIRSDLERKGCVFRTHSDSEILLHLYELYGTGCLRHMRGEFAFVLWDQRNKTLFAGRDRFGIKPIFYAVVNGDLHIASEAKALFAAGVPAEWDDEMVFQTHSGGLMPPGRSLFRGVNAIVPGHFMIVTPEHQRMIRYWDFDYPKQDSDTFIRSEEEAIDLFRDKFEESVRLRLRADVPVGFYLSGGLDSCSILGVASKLSSQPLHAFTLQFESGTYDESGIAKEMAAHAGAHYKPLRIRPRDLAENFADALWHGETPFFNAHAVAKFLLSKFVHGNGFKVVMTGEGSDEIFGGYVHFRRDWLLYNSDVLDPNERVRLLEEMKLANPVSRAMLPEDGKANGAGIIERVLGFVPTFLLSGHATDTAQRFLSDRLCQRCTGLDPARVFINEIDVDGQLRGRDPLNQSLYLWSKTVLPGYLLSVLGDRMEMAHSIEGRVPFLDHELVELVARIPASIKVKGMREKHILREAVKPKITNTVYNREKHPFMTPPAAASEDGALYEFMNDTLRGDALKNVSFYNSKAVIEMLDIAATASAEEQVLYDPLLMRVLSHTLMQEKFGLRSV